jgi:hypothetical protein
MRIARVIHERSPLPKIALERDGALYDVGALEQRRETRRTLHLPPVGATDFFVRVVSLRCAGLAALDEQLCAGDRPTEARLLPETLLWLPPCDTDRALYVHVEPAPSTEESAEPAYRIGNARGLLGHDAKVVFPPRETRPAFELGIAALLGEDLRRATPDEVEEVIAGYTILNTWTARDEAERHRTSGRARDWGPQIGPLLVTRSQVGDVARLRMQARVGGQVVANGIVGPAGESLAEAIAFTSHSQELRAGDLIGVSCMPSAGVPYGATVDVLIERLGKLTGCPVEGPELTGWRRRG